MKLSNYVRETVRPVTPTPPAARLLRLSNNDLVMPRVYTRMLYYYLPRPRPADDDVDGTPASPALLPRQPLPPATLCAALAQALALYYPLAGRLVPRADDSAGGALDVACTDAGAFLVHADAADADLAAVAAGFHPAPDLHLLVPSPPDANADADADDAPPLLLAQVTRFRCGGTTLGVAVHHSVADGAAVAGFVRAWNELALGHRAVSVLPCHDREPMILAAKATDAPRFPHPEYNLALPSPAAAPVAGVPPAMAGKRFLFTPAQMAALKRLATAASADSDSALASSVTGFEALTGHLWRLVTRARALPPSQALKLGIAVDGRRRLRPPLPLGYAGNANFYGLAEATAGALAAEGLPGAAARVSAAVARVSDAYVRSALAWVERAEGGPGSVLPSFVAPGVDLAVTSWTRFPVYEVGMGMGRPDYVGVPAEKWDGLVVLLPGHLEGEDGGVNALVGLKRHEMARLESDSDLFPPLS